MYEKIAWNNFIKTGDVQSFLEYRRLVEMNQCSLRNEGVQLVDETYQNKGDCNQRNTL